MSKSKEILKLKVKGIYFIVDVNGSLPLDLFTLFIEFDTGCRMRPLLKLNQLIGMVKVILVATILIIIIIIIYLRFKIL